MRRWLLLCCALFAAHGALAVESKGDVRLKELGRIHGCRDNSLIGYGLVTGLAGTGDWPRNRATRQSIANLLSQFGVVLPNDQVQSRNVAAVMVLARLRMARSIGAEPLNYEATDVQAELQELTGGRGPDACIDAVGMEAHFHGMAGAYDRAKQALRLSTERPGVLRQASTACRSGGTVSVPGAYGGFVVKPPFGAIMNKGITIRSGQTHVQRYMRPLLGTYRTQGVRSVVHHHAPPESR